MTREEWDAEWWKEFSDLRHRNPTTPLDRVQKAATLSMNKRFGNRPKGEAGPPWWSRIAGPAIGVSMDQLQGFWDFMNGKKTVVGLIITALGFAAGFVPALLAALGVGAVTVVKVTGILTTVLGVAHKIYKFVYNEEHK